MSTDRHEQAVGAYRRRVEAAAIGGLILQPHILDQVSDWLQPGDFTVPHYGDWYTHLLAMRDRYEPIDQLTLLTALRRADQLGPQGRHADELASITMTTPVPASTIAYSRSVLEESIRDRVAAVGVRLTQLASSHAEGARALVDEAARITTDGLRPLAVRCHNAEGDPPTLTR